MRNSDRSPRRLTTDDNSGCVCDTTTCASTSYCDVSGGTRKCNSCPGGCVFWVPWVLCGSSSADASRQPIDITAMRAAPLSTGTRTTAIPTSRATPRTAERAGNHVASTSCASTGSACAAPPGNAPSESSSSSPLDEVDRRGTDYYRALTKTNDSEPTRSSDCRRCAPALLASDVNTMTPPRTRVSTTWEGFTSTARTRGLVRSARLTRVIATPPGTPVWTAIARRLST